MRIKFLAFLALAWLSLSFQESIKLSRTKINDHITIKLPVDFRPVSEQELSEKYVSSRKPIALYTSPDQLVDFSVNVSTNQWQHFDLPLVKDFYKASLSTLFSDLQMMREETTEIAGYPAAVFEFIGTVEGEENAIRKTNSISNYHQVAYVLVNGKVAVFTLKAPAKQGQRWSPVGAEMLESLKLKKTL